LSAEGPEENQTEAHNGKNYAPLPSDGEHTRRIVSGEQTRDAPPK
jgi:hypothetical protein